MDDDHAAGDGGGSDGGGGLGAIIPISPERREFANVLLHYAAVVETMREIERCFDSVAGDKLRTLLLDVRDRLRVTREVSVGTEDFLFAAAMTKD